MTTDSPIDPIPTTVVPLLIIAVVALAGVVVFLWKYYAGRLAALEEARQERDDERSREREQWTLERIKWAAERAVLEEHDVELRAEFEERHRVLIERHAALIRSMHEEAREQEAIARREYTANMEIVALKAAEANSKIGAILDRCLERFVGARRPSG